MGLAGDGLGDDGNDALHGKDVAGNKGAVAGASAGGIMSISMSGAAGKSSTLGFGGSGSGLAGLDQAQMDKAEQQYRKLEHEFKVQLGLIAGS